MSTRYKEDAYVLCPFYRKETAIEVRCAGMCGSHTTHYFDSGGSKRDFKDDFCCGYYWNCPCYIALEQNEGVL